MRDSDDEATRKQFRFAKELGIRIPQGVDKWELSRLITAAIQERDRGGTRMTPRKKSSSVRTIGCFGVLAILGVIVIASKVGSSGKPNAPALRAASPDPVPAPTPIPQPLPAISTTLKPLTAVPSLAASEAAAAARSSRLAQLRIQPEYRVLSKAVSDSFGALCLARNGGTAQAKAAAQTAYDKAVADVAAAEEKELSRRDK